MEANFKIEVTNTKIGGGVAFDNIDYKVSKFNAGEINVRVSNVHYTDSFETITITGRIISSNDIMELLLLNDAIDRMFRFKRKNLDMSYVPYSRQDRVCNIGESLSIKVFANLINSCNFDTVLTQDNHSDVSTALINNCQNIEVQSIVNKIHLSKYDYIISPDAGANKKIFKVSQSANVPMVQADKIRDTATGEISHTIVHSDWQELGGTNAIIVDDICDGGRTFLELAKVLKSMDVRSIDLYVTHGIFANGLEAMKDAGIENFYCSNNLFNCEGVHLI